MARRSITCEDESQAKFPAHKGLGKRGKMYTPETMCVASGTLAEIDITEAFGLACSTNIKRECIARAEPS